MEIKRTGEGGKRVWREESEGLVALLSGNLWVKREDGEEMKEERGRNGK